MLVFDFSGCYSNDVCQQRRGRFTIATRSISRSSSMPPSGMSISTAKSTRWRAVLRIMPP